MRIEGLNEFRNSLKRYAEKFPKETSDAIKEEGFNLQAMAKSDAPVDTGKLVQSINLEIEDEGLTAKVTANVPYAPYVEFGTGGEVQVPDGWEEIAAQFKGKGIWTINMKPQPYLVPNFVKVRRRLTERIRKKIGDFGR